MNQRSALLTTFLLSTVVFFLGTLRSKAYERQQQTFNLPVASEVFEDPHYDWQKMCRSADQVIIEYGCELDADAETIVFESEDERERLALHLECNAGCEQAGLFAYPHFAARIRFLTAGEETHNCVASSYDGSVHYSHEGDEYRSRLATGSLFYWLVPRFQANGGVISNLSNLGFSLKYGASSTINDYNGALIAPE